jgi:hypothetical protein
MEIVPTPSRKKENSFDALVRRKQELKSELAHSKKEITDAYEQAFTLEALSAWTVRRITQRISLIDSAVWGFKIASRLRNMFRKK